MAISKDGKSLKAKRKTEAPGQALGFGLQYTRLTHLLLEAPEGSQCSLEYLDDVAQQDADMGLRLVQSKSALTANPVADRAKSLWKTLANWVALAATSGCDPANTIFEIYVSRPVSGKIVEALSDAKTVDAARTAVNLARSELWGEPPEFNRRMTVADDIAEYVDCVFAADPDSVTQIVSNFRLTQASGSPQADLESIIRRHPVSASKVADIADHMCGVVKRRVDELLEAQHPAIISRDDFYTWYGAYLRKIDRDTVLLSRARAPTEEESRLQLPKAFVQQLEIIGLSFEDKLGAVSDYLMAAADRTEWAAHGEVDVSSFDDLDLVLRRSWTNKRRACEIQHRGKPDEELGQALYSDCMQVNVQLQSMNPPGHFIPGCLHRLADDLAIGWHPIYKQHLKVKRTA